VKVNSEYVESILRASIARYIGKLEEKLGSDVLYEDLLTSAVTFKKLERAKDLLRKDLQWFSKALAEELDG
jgi:hypothetical protein